MTGEDSVLVADLPVGGGKILKRVTLNAPKALNSLTLGMARWLQPQLLEWEANDKIVAIFIEGAGDKAFCAGGDIVQIYLGVLAMDGKGEGDAAYPDAFFEHEYRLDYRLHTLAKPIIVWGDGIAMGGGLGIFAAGSHRVVTENARLAMPEITIGLFPDVGATWFLNRMPGRSGLFLGLTGAHMNAGDALFTGLADRFLPAAQKNSLLQALAGSRDWDRPRQAVDHCLRQAARAHQAACPASPVREHLDRINAVTDADSLAGIVGGIRAMASNQDRWLARAAKTLDGGCPTTAHLIFEQIKRGGALSLRDCFLRELKMARQCIRHPDFREGVRALLIDKDASPRWQYRSVAEVPPAYVQEHFEASWHGDHPLADLAAENP